MSRIVPTPVAKLTSGAMYNASTGDLDVSIKAEFKTATSGNYKVACVIVEDSVKGTAAGYNQANYYAGGTNGVMGGFETKANPVPAAQMQYDHVARAIAPDFYGVPNAYPASVSAGAVYAHNFKFNINAWNKNKIGFKHSEESKLKIGLASKGNKYRLGDKLSNETKLKMSLSAKGKIKSEEHRKNLSLSHKGKIKSKEHRENIAKARTGTKIPEQVKAKMRLSNKSKIITSVPISCYDYYTSEFIENFSSVREAAKKLGCLETAISNNLYGRSKKVNSKILNKQLKIKKLCH
jgi:hypothetical protein